MRKATATYPNPSAVGGEPLPTSRLYGARPWPLPFTNPGSATDDDDDKLWTTGGHAWWKEFVSDNVT